MATGGNNDAAAKTILFDVGKRELFGLTNGYKTLHRKLRNQWKFGSIKEDVTEEKISGSKLLVFAGPREKFKALEFDVLHNYMKNGGSILLMLGEGGETRFETNVNYFLEAFGIKVETDAVVRSSYYKYLHPKECVVSNGVVNRELNKIAGKELLTSANSSAEGTNLSFVYPYGATLTVQKPAVPVLSSGTVSLPVNRPVCAFHPPTNDMKGKLAVIGSCHLFHDQYIDEEENSKVFDVVFQWLTTESIKLDAIDAEDPDISEYHYLPQTEKLAEQLRSCLQEGDEVPRDFTELHDPSVFNIETTAVPAALDAYKALGVKHEPLTLITPQFETPLPPLAPAVFPPTFREPAPPALDLFDLDDSFSSERVRLAQLTNKCNEGDLEYYVRECGSILGVNHKIGKDANAKQVLEYVFRKITEFKKGDQG
eukprot:m.10720 g.10720  ORF g.10720 m.10720 type:complete len:426 (+) comp8450_c0_seq1:246-1523(+)